MGKHRRQAKPAPPAAPKNKHIQHASNPLKPPKGMTPLFSIVPEGQATKDAFAALGYDQEEEHEEQNSPSEEEVEVEENFEEEEEEMEGEEDQEEFDEEGEEEEGDYQDEDEQEDFEEEEGDEEDEMDGQEGEEEGEEDQEDEDMEGEEQENDKKPTDISVMNLQIQETISILASFPRLSQGKPRKHYITELKDLLHRYYGYNHELIDHFMAFLNPAQLVQLFEANETQRPTSIRTNTLKTRRKELAQSLIQRGVRVDPLADWSNVGIKVYESKVPIGATPEYLAGHYMLQSASSFLPVLALAPQPGEKVLDLASAPGGKTTYMAQLMKNTGCLFANDLKKERLRALQFNLYRLGVTNTVVTCRDGRKYGKIFPNSFDKVLLDAPCTGLGIVSKDPSIKANRLLIDIYKNSHVQKELLLAAIDSARVGGTIVYSTCSVSPLQNEEVVNYALKRRFVRVVEAELEVGEEGLTKFVEKRFSADLKHTRRVYPHVHNMDGFYVAKLVKLQKGKRAVEKKEAPSNQ